MNIHEPCAWINHTFKSLGQKHQIKEMMRRRRRTTTTTSGMLVFRREANQVLSERIQGHRSVYSLVRNHANAWLANHLVSMLLLVIRLE